LRRITTGAFRVCREVGSDDPPHLEMPLTVEPLNPWLCLDARFLNLWMRDAPFSLDRLADVPHTISKTSVRVHQVSKCEKHLKP